VFDRRANLEFNPKIKEQELKGLWDSQRSKESTPDLQKLFLMSCPNDCINIYSYLCFQTQNELPNFSVLLMDYQLGVTGVPFGSSFLHLIWRMVSLNLLSVRVSEFINIIFINWETEKIIK
jgi:hypothetical protein